VPNFIISSKWTSWQQHQAKNTFSTQAFTENELPTKTMKQLKLFPLVSSRKTMKQLKFFPLVSSRSTKDMLRFVSAFLLVCLRATGVCTISNNEAIHVAQLWCDGIVLFLEYYFYLIFLLMKFQRRR
jgi:hypothetical protein